MKSSSPASRGKFEEFFLNALVAGDPETPIFRAPAGMPVRFRLVAPGGTGDNQQVFELTGHVWQDEPYTRDSTEIGPNPRASWTGTQGGYGPSSHYDVVIDSAGGSFRVPGDYFYRSWPEEQLQAGLWGVFRVSPSKAGEPYPDIVTIHDVSPGNTGRLVVRGVNTVMPFTRVFARKVTISAGGPSVEAPVDDHGRWQAELAGTGPVTVRSEGGGVATRRMAEGEKQAELRSTLPRPLKVSPRKHPRQRKEP